jgi:hypothetical protein
MAFLGVQLFVAHRLDNPKGNDFAKLGAMLRYLGYQLDSVGGDISDSSEFRSETSACSHVIRPFKRDTDA